MKFLFSFGLMLFPLILKAESPSSTAPIANYEQIKSGQWSFSLLPKAFQRNPALDMTTNTEVTEYGRVFRPASPVAPVYCVFQSGGFKQMGAQVGGQKSPPVADIERVMKSALVVNGYVDTDFAGHPPSLLVAFSWGSHTRLDYEDAQKFPQLAAQHKLERALLIGGKKYQAEQAFVLQWGNNIADQTLEREYLEYQAADSLYFVIVSAYDYVALGRGEKKLVWRTIMTVNSAGVSLRETLPPLIANAALLFGRDTGGPQISQRRVKSGSVNVGTPTVVGSKDAKP